MSKKNQTTVNLITNILAMGINMLISIWIAPFLINKLGLAAYGYIGVINNLISFLSIITYTLTSMVGRFLIVSLKRDGPKEASKYVSSALFTNLFIGSALLILVLLLGDNLDRLLTIEPAYRNDVKIAFILGGISFIITSIYMVFSAGAYSRNRLDITNGISTFSSIVRVVFLVSIISLAGAQIWHYAAASVLQIVIMLILAIFAFRFLLPDVHFNVKYYNRRQAYEVLSSGFLISIIMLGNNFLTQIDLLVGNKYLHAEIIGMYAAVLLLPNSIRNIASAISSAFTPTTISIYSSGNMDELRKYSNYVVKLCGLLIGWPVAVLSGLAIPILKIWLKKDYSPYEFTIILMLLPLTLQLAVNQLFNVQQAMNRVRIPAIASIVLGVMNILLAIFFTATLDMGIFGLVLSGVTISTVRTFIFIPLYTAYITNQPKLAYYKGLIVPFLISIATCVVGILIQRSITIDTLIAILCSALGLSVMYLVLSFFSLNVEERKILFKKLIPVAKQQPL